MRTYPIVNADGSRILAFEIENAYVSRGTIAGILKQVDGVENVRRPRFVKSHDVRIEFSYQGREYVVWEPYGDNSRYWIGLKESEAGDANVLMLEAAFKRYRPPLYRQIIGDILSLRFLKWPTTD
jgi:hypothetical protein